jgi:hypothetical protein
LIEQSCHPKITCFAPAENGYSPVTTQYFKTPLRVSRLANDSKKNSLLTYGHYFQAIMQAISKAGFRPLREAVSNRLKKDVSLPDIGEIQVFSEKHGSDYHPARIQVSLGDGSVSFVMNVAVTERGKIRLENEFHVLKKLDRKYGFSYLPQAYFQSETLIPFDGAGEGGGEKKLRMFLADWLEGFHEFHLSVDEKESVQKIVVWQGSKSQSTLTKGQARQLYQQVAKIMTLYYDLATFEQIFPWHHAAGDFVVKTEPGMVDVKLITVRQYTSMIASCKISIQDALLFFLLNLTLRNRLDRLDGVGDIAWAQKACVEATIEGFLEGLKIKERLGPNAKGITEAFLQHSRCLSKEYLYDMFHALVDSCDPAAPDIPVIRNHLQRHMATLYKAFQKQRPW